MAKGLFQVLRISQRSSPLSSPLVNTYFFNQLVDIKITSNWVFDVFFCGDGFYENVCVVHLHGNLVMSLYKTIKRPWTLEHSIYKCNGGRKQPSSNCQTCGWLQTYLLSHIHSAVRCSYLLNSMYARLWLDVTTRSYNCNNYIGSLRGLQKWKILKAEFNILGWRQPTIIMRSNLSSCSVLKQHRG